MYALKHEWHTRHMNYLERSIITYLMTGSTTAMDKPEFAALTEGFKIVGMDRHGKGDLFKQLGMGETQDNYRGMISYVYNTSITDVEQVIHHIVVSTDDTRDTTPEQFAEIDRVEEAFGDMLRAWVRGAGHPDNEQVRTTLAKALARDVEPKQEHQEQARAQIRRSRGDPFLRAKLLLTAVTGSERRPLNNDWKITVRARSQ